MTPAAGLLSALESRGVVLNHAPGGDLRVRPASALTPTELAEVKALKLELLRLLTRRNLEGAPSSVRANPWPYELAGHNRVVGGFEPCVACAAGTWVVYGGLSLCLPCVTRIGLELVSYRNALERCWALGSIGERASRSASREAVREVARLGQELGINLADRLYRKLALAYWTRSGTSPCCGERGEYHSSTAAPAPGSGQGEEIS